MNNSTTNPVTQIITQAINAWAAQNKQVTAFFDKYEDSVYSKEVAPDRSRAIYILGHLIAVNDGMITLFGLGDRLYPELEPLFVRTPDRAVEVIPTISELKQKWATLNTTLSNYFNNMTTESWLDRHTAVSAEDFEREPLRNKFNVLLSRTNHQSYHMGQLNLIKG